jgi:hypothetical protein
VKLFPIFALAVLFAAPVFAYDVAIKVTVSQDTLAVGTNVTIVKDGTFLYSAKADGSGMTYFKLDAGSYLVYLDRGGYSRHVNILEVGKSENITYTLRQAISYASAYGQVSGPADFSGASVAAYANGNVVKRIAPNRDGYYLMSFMPEGQYALVFTAPGFVEKNVSSMLLQSQFTELNAKLDRTPVAPTTQPSITVPSSVQRQSVIEILLADGIAPLSGQVVLVKTPAGSVEVTTGADGKAHVNAAAAGEYIFTYGNLTAKTLVAGAENATAKPPVVAPEPSAPPAATQPQANTNLMAGLAAIVMGGVVVALGIILFVASRLGKKPKAAADAREGKEAAPAEGHAHSHKHAPEEGHSHEAHQREHGAAHAHPHAKHEHKK